MPPHAAFFLLLLSPIAARPAATPAPAPAASPAPAETAAAAPAPATTTAVVVLKTGQSMVVRSYDVDGRLVRIVDEKGEPLVLRADLVDLEKSEAATRQHRADIARARSAETAEAEAHEAAKREKVERDADHRAKSSHRGAMSLAREIATPAAAAAPGGPGGGAPAANDVSSAGEIPDRDRRRLDELTAKHNQLVHEHNALVDKLADPMAARSQIVAQINGLQKEIDDVRKSIEEIRSKQAKARK